VCSSVQKCVIIFVFEMDERKRNKKTLGGVVRRPKHEF